MAFHFLRALARISLGTPTSSPMQRSRHIRLAAYASMARAAGPQRLWSQALLQSLRRRVRRRRPRSRRALSCRQVGLLCFRPREPSRTDMLRSVVPGGKAMDLCSLLEETAHYVQCLRAQVRLMQAAADALAATGLELITSSGTAPTK